MSKVLDEVRNVMQSMIDGQPPDAAQLLSQIEKARAWNAELRGVDRLWSLPWKYEFAEDLLDHCSSIYVVACSMQGAAFKLQEDTSRKILQELLPPQLPARIRDLTEAVLALLRQEVPQAKEVEEVLKMKAVDHKRFCSGSYDGASIQTFMEKDASFTEMTNSRSFLSSEKMGEYLKDEGDFYAATPIIHGLCSIRDAITNIEVVLQMQEFLAFGRWDIGGALERLKSFDFHEVDTRGKD
jgi:hypothetical protein